MTIIAPTLNWSTDFRQAAIAATPTRSNVPVNSPVLDVARRAVMTSANTLYATAN